MRRHKREEIWEEEKSELGENIFWGTICFILFMIACYQMFGY